MDFETPKSHVYILVDDIGRVTQIEGEYSISNIQDLSKAILVEEGEPCDRLNHAQNAYLPKPLYTDDGLLRYKWTGTEIVERTEEELEADRAAIPAPPPTPLELLEQENKRLKAQAAMQAEQTAMLEDCLLEMAEIVYA